MQLQINSGKKMSEQSAAYFRERGWVLPPPGSVLAIAMDASGRELGQAVMKVADGQAKEQAAKFVEAHRPPVVDARKKWDEAFALAQQTNRRVWVRISQRYCGPMPPAQSLAG